MECPIFRAYDDPRSEILKMPKESTAEPPSGPTAIDVNGSSIEKGDTVTTITGSLTARVCNISIEFDTSFVQLRPLHLPSAKAVWHAADHVLRLARPTVRPKPTPRKPAKNSAR